MAWFRLTIELTCLTLGTWFLYFKHQQRARQETDCFPQEDPEEWTGEGIETSELKARIAQVRWNYTTARQATTTASFHRYLLGVARRAVMQLGYFRHRGPGDHVQDHGP